MAESTKTDEAVEREVAQLAERIEALRNLARERGLAFSALTDEQLVRKVRGETANSPFIFAQAWTSGTTPGSAATYPASVQNPDPTGYFPVYMTIFFGLGTSSMPTKAGSAATSGGQNSRRIGHCCPPTQIRTSCSTTPFRAFPSVPTTETRCYGRAISTTLVSSLTGAASI